MFDTIERRSSNSKSLPLQWDICVITPEIAASWLEKNSKNRKLSDKVAAQYSRDMKSGNWRLTGDPIRFDVNGDLIDGQHRLKACIASGVNFTSAVIYGLQPSDQNVIDTARRRTANDTLALHGYHGTSVLAAMCRQLAAVKANLSLAHVKLSTTEVLRIVEDRPKMTASVGMVWTMPPGIPRPALGLVHYIAANVLKQRETADAFVAVFKTGVPAYEGCPAHALRERLIRKGDTRNAVATGETLRAYMHAWNCFVKREPLTYFKIPKDVMMHGVKVDKL